MASSTAALTLKKLPVVTGPPTVAGGSKELPPRSVKMRTLDGGEAKVSAVLWQVALPPAPV
jgi:hypothetical protein